MEFLGNLFKSSHDKEPIKNPTQKLKKENPTPPESLTLQFGSLDQFSIITPKKSAPSAQKQQPPEYFWPIGKIIGGIYPIRGYLGRSGFGQVYRCYDEATHKDIAVKIPYPVHPETQIMFVDTPAHKESILNEVRNWIDLAHPNIVHAFDVRDDQSTDYLPAIFMESCDGGSLPDYLKQNSFTLADRIDAAIQVCWAMEYAHNHGLLHLDLKPQNILMTSEGIAKVTDFGLARAMTDKSTIVCGTPVYMAPEQWIGNTEKASDIYSFGVMLYYMVYGRWPFIPNGKDDKQAQTQLKQMHCNQKPEIPTDNNNHIPVKLSELILDCLAKKVMDRLNDFEKVGKSLCDCYNTSFQTKYFRIKPTEEKINREMIYSKANALVRLGIGCHRRGDFIDAIELFKQGQKKFEEIHDKNGLSVCIGNQAGIYYAWGQLDETMQMYKQEEVLCKELGDKAHLARNLSNQGVILRHWNRLQEAMELHQQEESICRELDDKDGLARSFGNQGKILEDLGRLDEAMQMHKQEEALYRKIDDKENMMISLGNQSNILRAWGKFDEAIQLYKQVEIFFKDIGNRQELRKAFRFQGITLMAWGQFKEAMEMFKREEAICRELGDKRYLAVNLNNQGEVLKDLERLEEAMQMYKQCEAICRENEDKENLSISLISQAELLAFKLNDKDDALSLANEAYQICNQNGFNALAPQIKDILDKIQALP